MWMRVKLDLKSCPLYDGRDDSMRLVALSEKNIGNRLLTVEKL